MSERLKAPPAGSEREMLEAFLDIQRDSVIRKVEGLDDESQRRAVVTSGLTLLGVVKHLAWVEAWWFRMCFAGEDVKVPWTDDDPDADFRVEPEETADDLLDFYAEQIARAKALTVVSGLEDEARGEGRKETLRWIMMHMIEETARHAGHMDILREQLDGQTGL